MIAGEKLDLLAQAETKHAFSTLIDAMRYSQRMEELEEEISSSDDERKNKLLSLERLLRDITSTIEDSKEDLGEEIVSDLSKQIPPFAQAAANQVKSNIEEFYKKATQERQSLATSEKTKLFKSLESFLATSPFPVLEAVTKLSFADSAYSAKRSYRCANNVEYAFSLDTKDSPIFGKEFRLSALEKEIRLPISLGKSWLKKEPTPEYERLDQYMLTQSEASEAHLIAEFTHPEKEAQATIVYSHQGSNSIATIKFKDHEREVDVTAEAGLNRFLKPEALERAMDRIWLATSGLEKNKQALTALSIGDEDILSQLDCAEFFEVAWRMITPAVIKAIKNRKESGIKRNLNDLNEDFVREKVAQLPKDGQRILLTLGLSDS